MKAIIIIILMSFGTTVFADVSRDFYECDGFNVDEYRVGINLKKDKAGFFDNDTISYLKLTNMASIETSLAQTILYFKGKDQSINGELELVFNKTLNKASLTSISKKGKRKELGKGICKNNMDVWEELK